MFTTGSLPLSPHVLDVVGHRYSGAPRGIAGSAFRRGLGKMSNTKMVVVVVVVMGGCDDDDDDDDGDE